MFWFFRSCEWPPYMAISGSWIGVVDCEQLSERRRLAAILICLWNLISVFPNFSPLTNIYCNCVIWCKQILHKIPKCWYLLENKTSSGRVLSLIWHLSDFKVVLIIVVNFTLKAIFIFEVVFTFGVIFIFEVIHQNLPIFYYLTCEYQNNITWHLDISTTYVITGFMDNWIILPAMWITEKYYLTSE